jgi:HEAT repeat protein
MMVGVVEGAGLFLALLTLAVVVNKALRELGEALDRRRRAFIEPAVLEHLGTASATPLRDKLPGSQSRRDRRLVEEILLESARIVKGNARDRMTAAFEALGSVREALGALRSRRWWRRADAAERLGLMRSGAAVEPLVALLNDPVAEVRIRAARALGLIRGSTSIRPLVSALADPSRWSAIRVAEILISVGAEAVDELLTAYETLPHHARVSALDVLGRIRSLRAAALMKRCLSDPHPDIRARAAHGLGLIADPGAIPDLIRALQDKEWPVRAMAAKSLGRLGGPAAIGPLGEVMKDRQWWVRYNSGEALRTLGRAGLEALTDVLGSEDPYARHMAVAQLEEGRVIDRFVTDLTSTDAGTRAAAIRFIDKVTAAAQIDGTTRQAARSAQEGVRHALSNALRAVPPAAAPGGPKSGRS